MAPFLKSEYCVLSSGLSRKRVGRTIMHFWFNCEKSLESVVKSPLAAVKIKKTMDSKNIV